jgi:hypothetical protein
MAKRPITDELLNLAIETKLDAGVSAESIRLLLEAFAGDDLEDDRPEDIIGFLGSEEIPPSRRGEFLTAVLALSPDAYFVVMKAREAEPRPGTFAISLLTKAKAALRFASA